MQNVCKVQLEKEKKKGKIWAERESPASLLNIHALFHKSTVFILVPMRTKRALVDWDVIVFLFFRGGGSHFSGRRGHFCLAESKHKAAQNPCLSTFMPSTCGIFHSITPQPLLPSCFGGNSSQRWRAAERLSHRPKEKKNRHLVGTRKQTRAHFYNFCAFFHTIFRCRCLAQRR